LRRIHKLYDTALGYVLSLDADYVLNHIVQNVGEILELDDCYVMLVDEETSELALNARWSSGRGPETAQGARILPLRPRKGTPPPPPSSGRAEGPPPWTGILERLVVQSVAPMIIPDTSTFPHFPRSRGRSAPMPASVVGVPLLFREKVIGTLTAACWDARDFDPEEVVALTQLATPASLAIENARLYTSLRERLREKEILLQGSDAMAGVHDLSDLLAVLSAQMARVVGDAWCGLLLREGDAFHLHAQATWEAGASLETATRQELDRGGSGGRGEAVRRPLAPVERPRLDNSPSARQVLQLGQALPLDTENEGDAIVQLANSRTCAAASLIPLVYQNRVLGLALVVLRRVGDTFRDDEYRLLQALANQAAVTIVNAQLLADEKQQAQEKALLLEAARIAASSLDLARGLEDFCELAARCLSGDACVVALTAPRGRSMDLMASHGVDAEGVRLLANAEIDLQSEVVMSGDGLRLLEDVDEAVLGPWERLLAMTVSARAMVAWPLVSQGPLLGWLLVLFRERPTVTDRTRDLMDGIARQAAIFVQNARLYQEVKVRAERLKAISDITEGINAAQEVSSIFSIVARSTRHIVPVDWTSLAIIERQRKIMRLPVMSYADDESSYPTQIYPLQESVVDQSARTRQPVLVDDLSASMSDLEKHLYATGMRSMLVVPLIVEGKTVATLNLASKRPNAFHLDHMEILQEMADHLATAIRNASMFEEIRRTNQDLRKMDAIKSDFLSVVAHELRTPLTIIKGYLFVLLKRQLDAFTHDTLETIDNQTDHLKELIENLLSLSRIDSTKGVLLGPNLQEMRLGDIVDEVVSNFKLAARKKGITLEASVLEDVKLHADRGMIVRVFYNLLGNALKFTETGGITIRVTPQDGHVLCEVSDTGHGIAAEHLGRIFERFYHVDLPERRAPAGTGLGLAIVQSIVESHGGKIWVESEQGKGTKFSFTLALVPPPANVEK